MNEMQSGGVGFSGLESRYLKLLLNNSPSPIFMFDEDLNYVIGTRFGLSSIFVGEGEELIGLSFREIFTRVFSPEWVERACADCKASMESSRSSFYEERLVSEESGTLSLQIKISTILDQNGNRRGVIVTINDITELAIAREKAMEASRAKSLFLTNMSHEIRTPMNAIKGLSELMLLTKLDTTQQDYANNIVNASNSLLKIINDVLDFSKIDGGKIEILSAAYDLASLLEDITNIAGLRTADKGLPFLTDIDPFLPSMLRGDGVRIKQVLLNLISNAVKYTQEGYVKLSVSSQKDENGAKLVFSVKDTGIGIGEDEMSGLFNAFRQMESNSARNLSGAGLGLPISRELVQLMGGGISVRSEYGAGSEFAFWVPQDVISGEVLASVNHPDKKQVLLLHSGFKGDNCANMLKRLFVGYDHCKSSAELEDLRMTGSYTHCIYSAGFAADIEKNKSRIGDSALISIRDMRVGMPQQSAPGIDILYDPVLITDIARVLNRENYDEARSDSVGHSRLGIFSTEGVSALIVDDNEVNLIVGGEILRQYGMEADEVEGGELALKNCSEKKYDVIFMDHMMPEMDGVEATRFIREGGNLNSDTPIIALTANAVTGMREFFLECGMNDFISKPIDLEEMSRILLEWLPKEKIIYEAEEKNPVDVGVPGAEDPIVPQLEMMGVRAAEALRRLEGNVGIYKAVLGTFAREVHQKCDAMKALAEIENWKDFQTQAHGIKGALANIGARDLSLVARNMEMAHREDNLAYVKAYLSDFVNDLHIFGQKLEALLASAKQERKQRSDNAPDIKETLTNVSVCLENLENDEAASLLDLILDSSAVESVNEKIESIRDLVSVFDYDGALMLIAEIMEG